LAPGFSVDDIYGVRVTLDQLRGKVVVIDFWATWCPPCRKSIPELVRLQKKYSDQGLAVLGFSLDDPRRTSDKDLMAFKDKYNINYKILRGDSRIVHDYFGNETVALPTLFIISRKGEIIDKQVGFNPGAVEKTVKKLVQ